MAEEGNVEGECRATRALSLYGMSVCMSVCTQIHTEKEPVCTVEKSFCA